MNRDGKMTFFNDYAQKFFGYSLDEILGKKVNLLLPQIESISGRRLEEMVKSILENPDEFADNTNENIRKNGERVWISWRNKAIRDSHGNIVGNLAIGLDITEHKCLEEKERISQELLRVTLNSLGEGVVAFDQMIESFSLMKPLPN